MTAIGRRPEEYTVTNTLSFGLTELTVFCTASSIVAVSTMKRNSRRPPAAVKVEGTDTPSLSTLVALWVTIKVTATSLPSPGPCAVALGVTVIWIG